MSIGWGQDCDDGVEVELWGECYNIEETISLNLSNQELNEPIPPEIGNLENLTMLDLSNVGLNGQIPPEIGNLENLTIVDLGHNQLTGQIPIQIGNLTNLEYLGFNHNKLIGEIPSEIGNLMNLTHIRLNYNQLIVEIPSEIGNLVNLEVLKLYNNKFTFVSDSICNLTNLFWSSGNYGNYDSNIYNNNLCPPYPECIEDYVGYQDTSECFDPGEYCLVGDEYGYYDCYGTCLLSTYFEEWLGDGFCDDSGISFNCSDFGYDCGDCSEDWDGTDPSGLCSDDCLFPGDVNNDSILNILDIVSMITLILDGEYDECGDVNSDGTINVQDIVIFVNIILSIP